MVTETTEPAESTEVEMTFGEMADALVGNLRDESISGHTLTQLKRELKPFLTTTQGWKIDVLPDRRCLDCNAHLTTVGRDKDGHLVCPNGCGRLLTVSKVEWRAFFNAEKQALRHK